MSDRLDDGTVGHDIEASPAPDNTPDPGIRALYDSDISTSVQQKFAAWYYSHRGSDPRNWDDSYFMVRSAQGEYIAYFGDISSSGQITEAERVIYRQVGTGGYGTAWTWSESHVTSGAVDLAGYTGYIYSSYQEYQASPYMVEYGSLHLFSFSTCCALILGICVCLYCFVRKLFRR